MLRAIKRTLRRVILGSYRGYGWALFEGFPNDLDWHRVRLTIEELGAVKYMNYPRWKTLSGDTRRVADGAENVGKGWPGGPADTDPSQSIRDIAAKLEKGESFAELILVGEPGAGPDQLVLVEGHSRATRICLRRHGA
jgi:hypothetical protein